jgi:hypothetical protein
MNHHCFLVQAIDGLWLEAQLNLSLGRRCSLCWLGKAQLRVQKFQCNSGLKEMDVVCFSRKRNMEKTVHSWQVVSLNSQEVRLLPSLCSANLKARLPPYGPSCYLGFTICGIKNVDVPFSKHFPGVPHYTFTFILLASTSHMAIFKETWNIYSLF